MRSAHHLLSLRCGLEKEYIAFQTPLKGRFMNTAGVGKSERRIVPCDVLVADGEWESMIELPAVPVLLDAPAENELWERLKRVRCLKVSAAKSVLVGV